MDTKEYTTIDRAALGWPSGEWDGEPDKVQWPDPETGLPCLALRNQRHGNWCGYVGVAEGHPMHGRGDNDMNYEVHGGVTFAGSCAPDGDEAKTICHVPSPGEPEHVWWIGFDCAHAWDYSPDDAKRSAGGYPWTLMLDEKYRTLAYVKNECASLAVQLTSPAAPEDDPESAVE